MLPSQALPRAILNKELCAQFGATSELKVRSIARIDSSISAHSQSRYHVVQEFNKGVYDYIIASDENAGRGEQDEDEADVEEEAEEAEDGEECKSSRVCLIPTQPDLPAS